MLKKMKVPKFQAADNELVKINDFVIEIYNKR